MKKKRKIKKLFSNKKFKNVFNFYKKKKKIFKKNVSKISKKNSICDLSMDTLKWLQVHY